MKIIPCLNYIDDNNLAESNLDSRFDGIINDSIEGKIFNDEYHPYSLFD